jgi:hypothetical protein
VTGASPRILYVTEAWTQGAQVRCLNVLRALKRIGKVEVVVLGDPRQIDQPLAELGREAPVQCVLAPQARPAEGARAKLRATLDPKADHPYGWAIGELDTRRLLRAREDFDLVWFFKQRAADMLGNRSWRSSVVDVDDLQSTYERATVRTGSPAERVKALRGWFLWRRREQLLGGRFGVVTVCSAEDRAYLQRMGGAGRVHVVPNGFERPVGEPLRRLATPPRVGFIGGFSHAPNVDGAVWFARHAWPRIRRAVPDARFRVIGKSGETVPGLDGPGIDRLGYLDDPSDEIASWSANVVPIRLGAGTRIKIAHGFSLKCPIVSTTLGAFGYGARDGREMYLADSPGAFADACVRTLRDPEAARQMAERAWSEFLARWTWDAIQPRIEAAVEDGLRSAAA